MNDPQWGQQMNSKNFSQSRDERKSALTKTAQMSLENSQNNYYRNYDRQSLYSNTGMQPISQVSSSEGDMRSQLRLIKAKMTFTSNSTHLDKETTNVNQQLNSINQRLQEKNTINTYNGYQGSSKNQQIPMQQRYNLAEEESNNYKISNSYNSTNNTNFGQQAPPLNTQSRRINNTNPNYPNNQLGKSEDFTQQPRNHNNVKANYQQQTYEPSANTVSNKNFNQLSYQQQQEAKKLQSLQPIQNKKENSSISSTNNQNQYNQNLGHNQIQEQSKQNNFNQQNQNQGHNTNQEYSKSNKQNSYNLQEQSKSTNQNSFNQNLVYNQIQEQSKSNSKPQQTPSRNLIDEISAVAKNQNQVNMIGKIYKYNKEESQPENEEDLVECPEGCGRQFREDALEKHTKICKKVFQSKRKQFNSKANRVVDDEQAKLQKQGQAKDKVIAQKKSTGKDPKWKQQSEQFRQMLQPTQPGDAPRHNPLEDDYVECPGCSRKFNKNAADKHVPYCKSKSLNKGGIKVKR